MMTMERRRMKISMKMMKSLSRIDIPNSLVKESERLRVNCFCINLPDRRKNSEEKKEGDHCI